MLKSGRFIVVEGLEGSGKTTAIKTIERLLKESDYPLITTREPGGTGLGEVVRGVLKEKVDPAESLDPRAELLLLYASRVELVTKVIRPALAAGNWVLSDRFELSTWAYQGGGRGVDRAVIQTLSNFCLQDLYPDLIFFLDIPVQLGLKRAIARGQLDRMEEESEDFFRKTAQAYQEKIQQMKNVIVIDATQPLSHVQSSIRHQIKAFLGTLS